jgi:beta-lactamase regulating signal transducer with metallopeptidase domain
MITLQNIFANLFSPAFLEALGWTLIHSVWQGALVAVLLAVVLSALKNNASNNRYVVSVTALVAMLQISLFTFFMVYETAPNYEYTQNIAPLAEEIPTAIYQTPNAEVAFGNAYLANISLFMQINLPYIVSIWLLGVLLFSIKFLGSLLYIQRLKTQKIQVAPENWQNLANEIRHKLRLRKSVKVLLSDLVHVPTAIGILKPIILMPISLQAGLTMQEVESILAHEIAHIRRNDYLVNIFQTTTEILFFFHPVVWWISGIIREERENCCDDMAVSILGDSMIYSRTLARMNEMDMQYTYTQTALAFHGKKGSLLSRIKRLFTNKNENNVLAERFAASTIILAAMLVSLTANAGLLTNKAFEMVKNVQENLPSVIDFDTQTWDTDLSDTTKRKKKILITVDENGKIDTISSNTRLKIIDLQGDVDLETPPIPPMPPMPPIPPIPPMPPNFMDAEEFEFEFIEPNHRENSNASVHIFDDKNGKNIVINGKKIDLDSLTKNAKTVNVENENGQIRIMVDGKVAKTIDATKIRKNIQIQRHNFAPFQQNNKSLDSLRNTKGYKKKFEKYQKALKEYQELLQKYQGKLPKNEENQQQWRAYEEALRDYEEAVEENARKYERKIEIEHQKIEAEHQKIEVEHQKLAMEHEKIGQIQSANFDKLRAEIKKDGFAVENLQIKMNDSFVEINGKKVDTDKAEKYRKMVDFKKGSTFEVVLF